MSYSNANKTHEHRDTEATGHKEAKTHSKKRKKKVSIAAEPVCDRPSNAQVATKEEKPPDKPAGINLKRLSGAERDVAKLLKHDPAQFAIL